MRLDKKRDAELATRKGLTTRTLVQGTWLAMSALIAYFALSWLFSSGQFTYEYFYVSLGIPRSIPEPVILGALVLVFMVVMQFFLVLGYAFGSPQGRERPGTPSPYSRNYDPMQDDYRN